MGAWTDWPPPGNREASTSWRRSHSPSPSSPPIGEGDGQLCLRWRCRGRQESTEGRRPSLHRHAVAAMAGGGRRVAAAVAWRGTVVLAAGTPHPLVLCTPVRPSAPVPCASSFRVGVVVSPGDGCGWSMLCGLWSSRFAGERDSNNRPFRSSTPNDKWQLATLLGCRTTNHHGLHRDIYSITRGTMAARTQHQSYNGRRATAWGVGTGVLT